MNLISVLLLSLVSLLQSNNEAELVFFGDAMQHQPQISAALAAGGGKTYDYKACFQHIESDIKDADYALVNLECTLGGTPYKGYPCFSAPESYAQQLRDVGFDLLFTANNHCLDRRDAGLRRTIEQLDAMGIPHIGTYRDAEARRQLVPHLTTINGIRFAFLSYTYGTNGIPVQGDVVVNYIDRDIIAADLKAARDAGAQVLCVAMHWGVEYVLKPTAEVQDMAQWLVEQGVDLIIGGHPHVVEPMEMRHSNAYDKDVLLVYSLGNFISNMNDVDCRGGAMVKVKVAIDGTKPRVYDPRYKLFFVQKPSARGSNFTVIPENRPDLLNAVSRPQFDRFMQRAHTLVMNHNVNVPCEP